MSSKADLQHQMSIEHPSEQVKLRDEFAMAALTGLLARPLSQDDGYDASNIILIVGEAYRFADAVLERRKA